MSFCCSLAWLDSILRWCVQFQAQMNLPAQAHLRKDVSRDWSAGIPGGRVVVQSEWEQFALCGLNQTFSDIYKKEKETCIRKERKKNTIEIDTIGVIKVIFPKTFEIFGEFFFFFLFLLYCIASKGMLSRLRSQRAPPHLFAQQQKPHKECADETLKMWTTEEEEKHSLDRAVHVISQKLTDTTLKLC